MATVRLGNGMVIKDTDKGWVNFQRAIKELAELRADVGYWGSEIHNDSALPVVYLAMIHEYGTEASGRFSETGEGDTDHAGIPARPFLREAADTGKDAIFADARRIARQVIAGKRDAKSMLRLIANKFKNHVKRTLDFSPVWAEPLAPSTIRKKGNAHPLEDTLEMRDMVKMRIRGKNESP